MGFSISWIAFKSMNKTEVLRRSGLRDTGVPDEANEALFSIAELPTGWVIVFSNDFEYGTAEHLIRLSADATLVSCQVEEHMMFSAAHCCVNARETWSVSHNSQKGRYDLAIRGTMPEGFASIEARLKQQQDDGDGATVKVDYIFDIPVELAAGITGYRHDRWKFDWGRPNFTIAERSR